MDFNVIHSTPRCNRYQSEYTVMIYKCTDELSNHLPISNAMCQILVKLGAKYMFGIMPSGVNDILI